MRSDSVKNMSASLTRITRQVSRTFDLNFARQKIINESFFIIHYIEVISQKTAQRVMDSITKYIESKLLLKVNRKKSKIGRPIEIKYLGFTFYNQFKAKKYKAKAHEKSVQKVVRKWNDQRQTGSARR